MRRAQASAEYLIILAIVLIITIMVIVATIEVPSSVDTYEDQMAQEYWRNADIGIVSWAANSTHITLKVINNMQRTIEIERITLDDQTSFTKEFTLEPGKSKIITGNLTWDESAEGEIYEVEARFDYEDIDTEHGYIFYGQSPIRGTLTSSII